MQDDWNIVLSILESPDAASVGHQQVFTTSPIKIGRAEDNDFIVSDPTVSREHATLRITNDYSRVFITDTSTHGTIVSEKPVPKGLGSGFTVQNGDTIKIGNTLLRFELNLKQSVQSTFIGTIDRSFLDEEPPSPEPDIEEAPPGDEVIEPELFVDDVESPRGPSPLYIGIIVVCVLILIYLIFFQ